METSITPSQIQRWMDRYIAWGARPSVAEYLGLFAEDATLWDSGLDHTLTRPELAEHMRLILQRMPDFRFRPLCWRANGSNVFVEAHNAATIDGRPVEWPAVYCLVLGEAGVVRGRRYYDRAPLYRQLLADVPAALAYPPVADRAPAALEPATDLVRFVERYRSLWGSPVADAFAAQYAGDGEMLNPGMSRPLQRAEIAGYYRFVLQLIPDLRMELCTWAGDEDVVFMEWRGCGSLGGSTFVLPVVDRFKRRAGRIAHGQAFFDSLHILAHIDPALGRKLREAA